MTRRTLGRSRERAACHASHHGHHRNTVGIDTWWARDSVNLLKAMRDETVPQFDREEVLVHFFFMMLT